MANVPGSDDRYGSPAESGSGQPGASRTGSATADDGAGAQPQMQRQASEAKRQGQQAQSEMAGAGKDLQQKAERAREEAARMAERAGEQTRDSAQRGAERARDEALAAASRQKDRVGEELQHFSAALRSAADQLHESDDDRMAHYAEMAAEQVDSTAGYLRRRDFGGLVDDADQFARRQPEIFFGGMFLAGLGISRFLKASRRDGTS